MYEPRFYRNWHKDDDLVSFEAIIKETDLCIRAEKNLQKKALASILKHREAIEKYIARHPEFLKALAPVTLERDAPLIVKDMIEYTRTANVGPMASVAGVIAEYVGNDLLEYSSEIIVENGGDIFIKTNKPRLVGVYAGNSVFTKKIALEILPEKTPLGICTSSGTVGPSLSFGKADAVIITAKSAILADAAATSIGNIIKEETDIAKALDMAQTIKGLKGIIIIKNDKMGLWGDISIK
ncbi:MAG: thiamine biosynthesis protein ApbE [Elusimicrobia bacterium RIFOXYA2_FULL_39_19]|nr:MAG: thiamine biosynthesis protein ApbE [Elusimicrobia bacterium RIFOXYA2_FULL_39_19]